MLVASPRKKETDLSSIMNKYLGVSNISEPVSDKGKQTLIHSFLPPLTFKVVDIHKDRNGLKPERGDLWIFPPIFLVFGLYLAYG